MFYSQFILAKKGPLGTIWIAAHLERKLRKNQVADTDIGVSVDSILFPDVPIALRLSSHLLLGVVRIYSRKVNYLFDDCSEALLKVKQAFRSTAVDLPPEQSKAPYHSITLPETFDLDDFELPDNEVFQGNFVDHHVSTREQITLQDTMEGVTFSTSQFGPDERFGDGDASQIGLDLDEELFLDKAEVAGTSGSLMDIDADPQASAKASSPFKAAERNEGVSDTIASPANYFSIQAPATPGLMEEPNLPSAEEALVSDDHMDEDNNPMEFAEKDMSGVAFSQIVPSNVGSVELHANGNGKHVDEEENNKAMSLEVKVPSETIELVSSVLKGQPPNLIEQVRAANGHDDIIGGTFLENERNVAADQPKGHCEANKFGMDGTAVPFDENGSVGEVHGCDFFASSGKTDLNGTCPPLSDSKFENVRSPVGFDIPGTLETDTIVASSASELQNVDQPCVSPKYIETFGSNLNKGFLNPNVPVLQACNSRVHQACNGADSLVCVSGLPTEDDSPCLLGLSAMQDATIVSGISTDVQGVVKPTFNTEQVTDADNSKIDAQLDNMMSGGNHVDKENKSGISDLSAPEKLLSMPNLPAGRSDDFLNDCTPGKEMLAEGDGDATGEKIVSGRKRSFTESTLTVMSLNSAESSGAAQSKRSVEFIPEDDDLLSSILGGRRSTSLKMKATPVTESVPAKRNRVAVRSSAHKRKVLVDDAMVLHGDAIRQQLTSTEDIRRVRKKAPCTHLEIWMLQKQFLEDEIFNEPILREISPALRSLHCEPSDLSGIRIVHDDGSKGPNEVDSFSRPILEGTGPAGNLGENPEHVDSLMMAAGQQDSTLNMDGSALQEEMKTFDNHVSEKSEFDVLGRKAEVETARVTVDVENHVDVTSEQASAEGLVSGINGSSAEQATMDSLYLNKTGDIAVSDATLDQGCDVQSTREDASTAEEASGTGIRDLDGDVNVSEKIDLDEGLDSEHLLAKMEGVDIAVVMDDNNDMHKDSSLPTQDVNVIEPMPREGGASPTSGQLMEERQLDEPGVSNKDEIAGNSLPSNNVLAGASPMSGMCLEEHQLDEPGVSNKDEHGGNSLPSNNVIGDDSKLDPSYLAEADTNSRNTTFTEKENLEWWDTDPKAVMDSTPIRSDYIVARADLVEDVIEHDTDFLNVDDDDVADDYESDMPNTEDKRILDNSGWSARTRAVASYLQVLFEKQNQHGKKNISLDNLLVGKSRKEASRMFFETLVLKTKDYIQAEQESSFGDIHIKPRGKLLKSEF